MRAMNIVVVNDYAYAEGGASKIALEQARSMQARGHRVVLFAAAARGPAELRGWTECEGLRTYLTGQQDIANDTRRGRAMLQGLWNLRAARMLDEVLDEVGADNTVILMHSWTKALSSSVLRAATRRKVPVVAVLHDYFISCPNGAYYNFQQAAPCTLQPLSMRCLVTHCDRKARAHKAWRVVRQFVQQEAGGLPDSLTSVVCVSGYQLDVLRPWMQDGLDFHVLPNPVPPPPADLEAQVADSRRFLFVGRLSSEKGALVFAKAARLAGVEAAFVGDGEQRRDVEHLLPDAPISGWSSADDVWRALADCRALVYPSLWHETFGLSVYEAASLAVPSIVSRETALSSFVRDGVNGLDFPQGDVSALARALERLASDAGLAVRLGRQARDDYARHQKSIEHYGETLEGILQGAIRRLRP